MSGVGYHSPDLSEGGGEDRDGLAHGVVDGAELLTGKPLSYSWVVHTTPEKVKTYLFGRHSSQVLAKPGGDITGVLSLPSQSTGR